MARTLQTGLSLQDVLNSVVDAALAVTGAERGFLLLRKNGDLETRVARNRQGATLPASDLRVPRHVIKRALEQRRDLLSMNFDPQGTGEFHPERSVVDLELRSVISVPLVRISQLRGDATSVLSTAEETVGVLYMDSRLAAADLAGGNRELLQTLAIEASTILENARLLEEERIKQQHRRRAERGAHHSAEPAAAQPARRRLVPRLRQQRGFAPGGRRLLRCDPRRPARLDRGGGGCLGQRRQLRAAGFAVAGRISGGQP